MKWKINYIYKLIRNLYTRVLIWNILNCELLSTVHPEKRPNWMTEKFRSELRKNSLPYKSAK